MHAPSSSPVNQRQHHSYPAHPMIQRSQYHQKCPGTTVLPRARLWREAASRCAIVVGSVMDGRDVAQFGSALDWGSRGRRFKSGRPDAGQGLDPESWVRPGDHVDLPLAFLAHLDRWSLRYHERCRTTREAVACPRRIGRGRAQAPRPGWRDRLTAGTWSSPWEATGSTSTRSSLGG